MRGSEVWLPRQIKVLARDDRRARVHQMPFGLPLVVLTAV